MKYCILTVLGIAALGGVWFLGQRAAVIEEPPQQAAAQQSPTATINGHVLELEIVRTLEEQSRGLSGRESLPDNAGMLFPYEKLAVPGFWMPDMNFSIDIIWIDKDFTIVGIENNVAPETFPKIFRPPSPIMYVLEVNATWAKDHNVTIGDKVVLNLGG